MSVLPAGAKITLYAFLAWPHQLPAFYASFVYHTSFSLLKLGKIKNFKTRLKQHHRNDCLAQFTIIQSNARCTSLKIANLFYSFLKVYIHVWYIIISCEPAFSLPELTNSSPEPKDHKVSL